MDKKDKRSSPESTFSTLQSQLRALLNRSSRVSKASRSSSSSSSSAKSKFPQFSHASPPDEANLALGKQIASLYVSLYFQSRCYRHDKLKAKWREEGFDFIQAIFSSSSLGSSNNNSRSSSTAEGSKKNVGLNNIAITSFFDSLAKEVDAQINGNGSKDNDDDLKTKTVMNDIYDDFSYWWVAVISNCEQQQKQEKHQSYSNSDIIVSASIRGYVKFAFLAHRTNTNIIHDANVNEEEEDIMQLVRLYKKLEQNRNRQYLIHELIHTTMHHDYDAHVSCTAPTASASSTKAKTTTTTTTTSLNLMMPLFSEIVHKTSLSNTTSMSMSMSMNENIYHYEEQNLNLYLSTLLREYTFLQTKQRCTRNDKRNGNIIEQKEDCPLLLLLPWFIASMEKLFIKSSPSSSSSTLLSLAFDYCCQLCDIITTNITVSAVNNSTSTTKDVLMIKQQEQQQYRHLITHFFNIILEKGFSILLYNKQTEKSASSSSSLLPLLYTIQPSLLPRLNILFSFCNKHYKINLSSVAMYNLAMTTLVSLSENSIALQLELISHSLLRRCITENDNVEQQQQQYSCPFSPMIWGLLYSVGHILLSTPAWMSNIYAQDIIELATVQLQKRTTVSIISGADVKDNHVSVPLNYHEIYYKEEMNNVEISKLLSSKGKEVLHHLTSSSISSTEQCEMLLLGLSSLAVTAASLSLENDHCKNKELTPIFAFLDSLLQELPELGIRSLPVLKVTLQHFITRKLATQVQKLLEFMCVSVARDASCAHEIWTMISTMIDPASSSASIRVQCMVLRLYPLLCNTNKRLYGRIIVSLGHYVSHPNLELKVVTASTICELAERDLIRDVSDVIGWVQSFLADEENMIVYYAILSLHHLVYLNELDYVIVLKVLNQKLVKFGEDVTGILGLDDIVIEALAQFLGNGETDDEDDSSESDEDEHLVEKNIPPHTQMSITALCRLALSQPFVSILNGDQSPETTELSILNAIYKSLSRYSIESFDIDEDLICQEKYDDDNLYYQLKQIIDGGNRCDELFYRNNKRNTFKSVITELSSKLEQIEQRSPVSARWIQQKQKKR